MSLDPTVFVHERALCDSKDIGPRTRVWAFAHVMPGARIGADCNVGDHAFVESGAVIGDRVTIKNAVLVWGVDSTFSLRIRLFFAVPKLT